MRKTIEPEHEAPPAETSGGDGWHLPKPEVLTPPSYWPLVVGFGSALIGFGVLTSYYISLVGLAVFVLGIAKWIGELCRETG